MEQDWAADDDSEESDENFGLDDVKTPTPSAATLQVSHLNLKERRIQEQSQAAREASKTV
jgi:hypothetical protein